MARRTATARDVTRAAAASTKASAKLEGRTVKGTHERSASVAAYAAQSVEKSR